MHRGFAGAFVLHNLKHEMCNEIYFLWNAEKLPFNGISEDSNISVIKSIIEGKIYLKFEVIYFHLKIGFAIEERFQKKVLLSI